MGFRNIEKKSVWYNLLFYYVRFWYRTVFYRKVVIVNYDNVPENKSLIFTPNHQNALMDALAMLFSVKNQLVFMARSDIFKKFATILYFLKILPIYRIRDGIDTLKKNQAVFDKTVDVLNAYNGLVILPEGNHAGIHRLRPLKKGFARIAFQTEETGKVTEGIGVVPVGIDYDDYTHCRSRKIIVFGKPIPVADFLESYRENPAVGLNLLKNQLAGKMKKLIIDIETVEYYDLINELRVIFRKEMCLKTNRNPNDEADGFYADRRFIELYHQAIASSPEKVAEINNDFQKLNKILKANKLSVGNLTTKPSLFRVFAETLLLVITFPVFVYGWINHLLPFQLPLYLTRRVKDEIFQTSFLFVLTMVFFPIFYLLQTVVVCMLFANGLIAVVYLVTLPLFAIISWKWKNLFLQTIVNFSKIKLFNSAMATQINRFYSNIIQKTNNLIDLYLAS